MIVNEVIPSVVQWSEVRDHCRLSGDDERDYLTGKALGAVESFEQDTGVAAGLRTVTVTYSVEDVGAFRVARRPGGGHCLTCGRSGGLTLSIPKGPVVAGSLILTGSSGVVDPSHYELRKSGHDWHVAILSASFHVGSYTLSYQAGHSTVPQNVKDAVLILTESRRVNRGALSSQQQYELAQGYQRIVDNYTVNNMRAG